MDYSKDARTVMTLDAGGTNFVFSAIQGNEEVTEEITLPSHADNLDRCIASMVEGFTAIRAKLSRPPVAISFAFPGPADYPNGIIGDLGNLPAFRGGVALGPLLSETFHLPVFINNDGDLYAFGEGIAGFLPHVNRLLENAGSPKRYKNLLGLTLGTGFGAGIVRDGTLFLGDNSIAGEIWLLRNKLVPQMNIEEHASIRGVRRIYAREAGIPADEAPTPKEIFDICKGSVKGNANAALEAFREMGEAVGDAIANAITLIDGLVVIGGGLAGAAEIFLPFVVNEMNGMYTKPDGSTFRRLVANVYNLENRNELERFVKGSTKEITVYGSDRKVRYDPEMRIGIGISKLGTSKAISIGAYAFALQSLDARRQD
ncbi:MAG: ROK family protein [Bacteroidota bacterium]